MNSYFSKYIKYKIFRQKSIFIFNLILGLLAFPVTAGTGLYCLSEIIRLADIDYSGQQLQLGAGALMILIAIVAFLSLFILCVLALVSPALLCRYNSSAAEADTVLSMPLTHTQRYFGDFIAGLFINIVPLAVNLAAAVPFCFAMKGMAQANESSLHKSAIALFTNMPKYLGMAVVVLFILILGIYIISHFMSTVCGRFTPSIVYSVIAMSVVPFLAAFCWLLATSNVKGLIVQVTDIPLGVIPPFGTVLMSVNDLANTMYNDVWELGAINGSVGTAQYIITALVYIGIVLAGYKLTLVRKSEKTGRPFAISGAYHVISMTCVIAILFFLPQSFDNVAGAIALIILAAIVYMFFELSHKRSFKKMLWSAVRFGCALVGCFMLSVICNVAGGMMEVYQPAAEEVKSVKISGEALEARYDGVTFSDKEAIKQMLDIQKSVIYLPDSYTGSEYIFTYTLNDGTSYRRSYSCGYPDDDVYKKIRMLDGYASQMFALDGYTAEIMDFYTNDTLPYLYEVRASKQSELISALKADVALESEIIGRMYLEFSTEKADSKRYYIDVRQGGKIAELLQDTAAVRKKTGDIYYTHYNEDGEPVVIFMNGNFADGEPYYFDIAESELENEKVKQLTDLFVVSGGSEFYIGLNYATDLAVYCTIKEEDRSEAEILIKQLIEQKENAQG